MPESVIDQQTSSKKNLFKLDDPFGEYLLPGYKKEVKKPADIIMSPKHGKIELIYPLGYKVVLEVGFLANGTTKKVNYKIGSYLDEFMGLLNVEDMANISMKNKIVELLKTMPLDPKRITFDYKQFSVDFLPEEVLEKITPQLPEGVTSSVAIVDLPRELKDRIIELVCDYHKKLRAKGNYEKFILAFVTDHVKSTVVDVNEHADALNSLVQIKKLGNQGLFKALAYHTEGSANARISDFSLSSTNLTYEVYNPVVFDTVDRLQQEGIDALANPASLMAQGYLEEGTLHSVHIKCSVKRNLH
jgi:hypothetical protein